MVHGEGLELSYRVADPGVKVNGADGIEDDNVSDWSAGDMRRMTGEHLALDMSPSNLAKIKLLDDEGQPFGEDDS